MAGNLCGETIHRSSQTSLAAAQNNLWWFLHVKVACNRLPTYWKRGMWFVGRDQRESRIVDRCSRRLMGKLISTITIIFELWHFHRIYCMKSVKYYHSIFYEVNPLMFDLWNCGTRAYAHTEEARLFVQTTCRPGWGGYVCKRAAGYNVVNVVINDYV
jgi:hypothetical protein